MILGLLSDAHGNLGAFHKAKRLLLESGATRLIFLGDAVGYFAGTGVVDALMAQGGPDLAIMGNHDHMLLTGDVSLSREKIYQLERVRKILNPAQKKYLKSLPLRHEETIDGQKLIFVHGSPFDELNGYIYPDTPIAAISDRDPITVFMGQTHRPFVRKSGQTTYINVGSCGLPRDHGGLGAVALYDTRKREATILRFPISDTSEAAMQSGDVADEVRRVLQRREPIYGKIHDI